jgi:hypothetical protein
MAKFLVEACTIETPKPGASFRHGIVKYLHTVDQGDSTFEVTAADRATAALYVAGLLCVDSDQLIFVSPYHGPDRFSPSTYRYDPYADTVTDADDD